jgi:hypothetical protein
MEVIKFLSLAFQKKNIYFEMFQTIFWKYLNEIIDKDDGTKWISYIYIERGMQLKKKSI